MKITILGTGVVGQSLAARLLELGHTVTLGTRNPEETTKRTEPNQMTGQSFADWYKEHKAVVLKAIPEATKDAELVINATSGHSY